MKHLKFDFVLVLALTSLLGAVDGRLLAQDAPQTPEEVPWRLQDELALPAWLRINGEIRVRWEGITGEFRSSGRLDNTDHFVVQRTRLRTDLVFDPAQFTLELLDSRHYGADSGSALNTGVINALSVLQAYAQLNLGEFGTGTHSLRAGRQTINLGSRRLVARNRYRNTINSFTGISWEWKNESTYVKAFWTMPVARRPGSIASLVDNDITRDDEDLESQFFGAFFSHELDEKHTMDLYGFGLIEDRGRKRELATMGARLYRKPRVAEIDYQLEGAFQFGDSRLSANGADLDHSAWFLHASVGYTFDATWTPRVRLAFDYASGDRDSTDGQNNRFDTLFGARRFEYGPTGIYGAIARSNLLSPELRLVLKPEKNLNWMFACRSVWLASGEDAWTTSGVFDPTGGSGRYVGTQVESRFRWDIHKDSLRLEVGAAYFVDGSFQRRAPGGQGSDTLYGYAQLIFKF